MTSDFTIVSGNVQDDNVFRVIAFIDQLRDKGSTASGVYKYTFVDEKWKIFNLDWTAIDLCVVTNPNLTLFILSETGLVMIINKDGYNTVEVSPGISGPSGYGPLRCLYSINSSVFAVGMGRQVYRISVDGSWKIFENGLQRPSDIGNVCGFNSIHGISENLLYAVGFNGEIWINNLGKWTQIQSPTNVILHCVRVMNDNRVFIGGNNGILLEGVDSAFFIIDTGIDDDIWGMEVFKGKLYFCSEKALYTVNDSRVDVVDIGEEYGTLRGLHSCESVICVFGPKTILKSNDGEKWVNLSF